MRVAGKNMPTVALNLVLAETRVFSGEYLNATVLLDSADPENTVQEFLAEIRGIGRTGWVNIRTDKIYETEQDYLNIVVPLCQRPMELAPGRHKFGLRVAIPETLPSSYESQFGSIRYSIRLQLLGNGDHSSAIEVFPFLVLAKSYLDEVPQAVMRHIDYEDEIDFTVCTLPFGTVRLRISLPRTGFCIGEVIRARIYVRNGSRKRLKDCRLQLVLKSQFQAQSRYEQANDRKLVETMLDTYPLGRIKGRTDLDMDDCVLRVPEQTIPSMQQNSRAGGDAIISLSYVLRFNALPGIETEIPIVITSLGYRNDTGAGNNNSSNHHGGSRKNQQHPMPRNGAAQPAAAHPNQQANSQRRLSTGKRVSIIEAIGVQQRQQQQQPQQFLC